MINDINWYPAAFSLSVDKKTLLNQTSLASFLEFFEREVDLGHIIRQELVSMIPALLLDIKHNHLVLDMCSAPGSKTEQLLAMMQQDAMLSLKSVNCSGIVVANDSDIKRIQTLINRFSKRNFPNLIITSNRAEDLTTPADFKSRYFNRILCDVPCSGDGTLRKCPHLWRLFKPRVGLDFHKIQV